MTGLEIRPTWWEQRQRILEVFFDCAESDVADRVVFTPIPAFYRAMLADAEVRSEHHGWWRMATVCRDGIDYSVVLHFEGTRVVDPVRALLTSRSRAAFLGLVGAVADGLDVGRLVHITSAGRAPGGVCSWIGPDRLAADLSVVRACTGNGLLDDPGSVRAAARRMAASVVDLESYFFFEALGLVAVADSVALGLVTDRPGQVPFWTVALDDDSLAAAGARFAEALRGHWSTPI
ncbi:hypothetical protein [Actinokineospora enzanensis]|uniref:hypothetical protein n=1 Tax=Actinokineospora enzanensis TaxID=155975 RepID=UPI00038207A9|nr:hypothetical protein [Actinokineospora enzanensis]